MSNLKEFYNLSFNLDNKTFTIHDGNIGTYDYKQIEKCSVVFEDANFTDKSDPFSHLVIIYKPIFTRLTTYKYDKYVYTGIKFTMKNGDILYAYISKMKLSQTSIQFDKERKEAEKIKNFCDKIINKYKEKKSQ